MYYSNTSLEKWSPQTCLANPVLILKMADIKNVIPTWTLVGLVTCRPICLNIRCVHVYQNSILKPLHHLHLLVCHIPSLLRIIHHIVQLDTPDLLWLGHLEEGVLAPHQLPPVPVHDSCLPSTSIFICINIMDNLLMPSLVTANPSPEVLARQPRGDGQPCMGRLGGWIW